MDQALLKKSMGKRRWKDPGKLCGPQDHNGAEK